MKQYQTLIAYNTIFIQSYGWQKLEINIFLVDARLWYRDCCKGVACFYGKYEQCHFDKHSAQRVEF